MKKNLIFTLLLLSLSSLFSEDNLFYISDESIYRTSLNEAQYNESKYYTEGTAFTQGLEIYSNTENVYIYFNGKKSLASNISYNSLPSGTYSLQIKKNGYKSIYLLVDIIDGKRTIINVTLAREYGFLRVNVDEPNSVIYLNNIKFDNNNPIPTGSYSLKVKSFGYEEFKTNILIIDNYTKIIDVNLEKAPFKLTSIKTNKDYFNPNAYEGFSSINFYISVNGPGNGNLIIYNVDNEIIHTRSLNFTNWTTKINFNGGDVNNLLDGFYTVKVETEDQEVSTNFNVDSTLINRNIGIYNGFSGLLNCPTAEINSKPILYNSIGLGYNVGSSTLSLPIFLSITKSDSLQFHGGLEIDLNTVNSESDVNLSLGLLYSYKLSSSRIGLNLNYNFESNQSDEVYNYGNSLIINTPITLNRDSIYFSITPEYHYNFNGFDSVNLSGGVHFDNQKSRSGISVKVNNILDRIDYNYGIEHTILLKNSQSYLGLSLLSDDDFNISFLLSLSNLY